MSGGGQYGERDDGYTRRIVMIDGQPHHQILDPASGVLLEGEVQVDLTEVELLAMADLASPRAGGSGARVALFGPRPLGGGAGDADVATEGPRLAPKERVAR